MQDILVPAGSFRGAPIPWWGKIAAKMVLSRLPIPHAVWSKLNIFRHSYSSRNPDEQVREARDRVAVFVANTGRVPHTILELGPGEITTCGVVYRALGVERTIFVDTGDFGSVDAHAYIEVAEALSKLGFAPPDLSGARDRSEIFARCGVEYHVNGLANLRSLPSGSADFITSAVVIEHIRLEELQPTFVELRRIMKPDGLAWHAIDFHDHLGGKLANLRFSPKLWESPLMASSGFYTNRASASRIIDLLKRAKVEVEIVSRAVWPEAPIARAQIASEISPAWTDEDLCICSMKLIARPEIGTADSIARVLMPERREPHRTAQASPQ